MTTPLITEFLLEIGKGATIDWGLEKAGVEGAPPGYFEQLSVPAILGAQVAWYDAVKPVVEAFAHVMAGDEIERIIDSGRVREQIQRVESLAQSTTDEAARQVIDRGFRDGLSGSWKHYEVPASLRKTYLEARASGTVIKGHLEATNLMAAWEVRQELKREISQTCADAPGPTLPSGPPPPEGQPDSPDAEVPVAPDPELPDSPAPEFDGALVGGAAAGPADVPASSVEPTGASPAPTLAPGPDLGGG